MFATHAALSPIHLVPADLMMNEILPACRIEDLKALSGVNKEWYALVTHDSLWQKLFPGAVATPEQSLKSFCCTHDCLVTEDQLYDRIAKFISELHMNQHGTFVCTFQHDPNAYLQIHISICRKILVEMGKAYVNGLERRTYNCVFVGTETNSILVADNEPESIETFLFENQNHILYNQFNKNISIDSNRVTKIANNKFEEIIKAHEWKGLARMTKNASLACKSLIMRARDKLH